MKSKIIMWVAVVLAILTVMAGSSLFTLMVCDEIMSEESWVKLNVLNVGTLEVSDKTGNFVYKDSEGKSYPNDWKKLAENVAKVDEVAKTK